MQTLTIRTAANEVPVRDLSIGTIRARCAIAVGKANAATAVKFLSDTERHAVLQSIAVPSTGLSLEPMV